MLIEIKDLKVGDEIIIPTQGQFKYLKILRPPKLSNKPNRWDGGKLNLYKGVYCAYTREEKEYTYTRDNGPASKWKRKEYVCFPEKYTQQGYINLNHKKIWLVKRENQ